MMCQLVGGPVDGKELDVDDQAKGVAVRTLGHAGLRELLYLRRVSDPTRFDYTPHTPKPPAVVAD